MRVMLNVADISRLHPMLCHYPELIPYMSIAHWRAPWLSCLSSRRFQQRISGQRQTRRKRELNWWIEQVFLKCMDNAMFHCMIRSCLSVIHFSFTAPQAAEAESLRTANESITRVTPLIIMLTPTNVPIAHAELE